MGGRGPSFKASLAPLSSGTPKAAVRKGQYQPGKRWREGPNAASIRSYLSRLRTGRSANPG